MIVPRYWAEARAQGQVGKRKATVRRFGWSDASEDDARRMAETRANEALARLVSGETVRRREPKVAYNGADGVPIREEIVERRGDAVITRNLYGARCLNTPDVLFADVDFEGRRNSDISCTTCLSYILAVLWTGICFIGREPWNNSWFQRNFTEIFWVGLVVIFTPVIIKNSVFYVCHFYRLLQPGGVKGGARRRIDDFVTGHPEWHLRLYETPAGFRLLAMHKTFDPGAPEVAEFFKAIGTDPIYADMCLKQRCFRARVSPKPWRIEIAAHMKPRPGVWPVNPERLPERARWIEKYEQAATGFASCRFVETLGGGAIHPAARAVQLAHDELSRATEALPIA